MQVTNLFAWRRISALAIAMMFFSNSIFAIKVQQNKSATTSEKPLTIFMLGITESASDVFDGISKRAVIHRELSNWQKNKKFASNVSLLVYAQAGNTKCSTPNLVSGSSSFALKVIEQSKPIGQLSSLQMLKSAIKKYSGRQGPVNLVLIGLGNNVCDVDICQQVASLEFGRIKTYVLGMGLQGKEKAKLQCLSKKSRGVFLNANNIVELKLSLQDLNRQLIRGNKSKDSTAVIKIPMSVKAGKEFRVNWKGAGNQFDRIVIRDGNNIVDSYIYPYANPKNKKVKNGSSVIMKAPAKAGQYHISYISTKDNKEITSVPLNVSKVVAQLNAPLSAVAGSKIRIEWKGPADQYDQIRIVAKTNPDKPLAYNYVRLSKNSMLFLHLPSKPGVYEIHYIGKDDKILANNVIAAIPAVVTIKSPATVVAGIPFYVSWQAPMNRYDRIRILSVEHPDKTLASVYVGSTPGSSPGKKSGAKINAPIKPGAYVLQYVSADKSVLAHRLFQVVPAKVTLQLNSIVTAGETLKVKWQGDTNQYDQIKLIDKGKICLSGKRSRACKSHSKVYASIYRQGHANLEAPEKAGEYQVVYVTRYKAILARHKLVVKKAKALIKPLAPVNAGEKFKVSWQGPANQYDQIRITRIKPKRSLKASSAIAKPRLNKSLAYVYVKMHPNAVNFTAPRISGEYEVQYLTRRNKCLAKTRLLVTKPLAK